MRGDYDDVNCQNHLLRCGSNGRLIVESSLHLDGFFLRGWYTFMGELWATFRVFTGIGRDWGRGTRSDGGAGPLSTTPFPEEAEATDLGIELSSWALIVGSEAPSLAHLEAPAAAAALFCHH